MFHKHILKGCWVGKAEKLLNRRYSINERYTIVEDVLKIEDSEFPNGIKASFVLLDTSLPKTKPRLLVDNTDHPHEFHMHTGLPDDKYSKVFVGTFDHIEALELFYKEVRRILNES